MHALEGGKLRRLTKVNDDLLAGLQLATTEDFTSKSKDGTVVNGLIVKPASFTPGTDVPDAAHHPRRPERAGRPLVHLRQRVLRGERLRGAEHQLPRQLGARRAPSRRPSTPTGATRKSLDLLGAVDQAVASGIADPDRLGIGGWSYGGILTDYTIATDTRFKAAVSGAGSALQLVDVRQRPVHPRSTSIEIGLPWKAQDLLDQASPIRSSRPTGSRRRRSSWAARRTSTCPIIGGEQMYQALQEPGRPDTQLVIYPGQFHGHDDAELPAATGFERIPGLVRQVPEGREVAAALQPSFLTRLAMAFWIFAICRRRAHPDALAVDEDGVGLAPFFERRAVERVDGPERDLVPEFRRRRAWPARRPCSCPGTSR
ncbi:MAG: prolyl oligopeptidase family serine peptidase [Candidatus Moduliflexus flocculans]|nr:prolyl oligopeptidase family serine peptidase [Candidatus Moduliflexus flocculans]